MAWLEDLLNKAFTDIFGTLTIGGGKGRPTTQRTEGGLLQRLQQKPPISPIGDPSRILSKLAPTPTPTSLPSPTPTPTPTQAPSYFGMGQEPAYVEPTLFDALMALVASEEEKRNIAELSGQESSYGYARPNITEEEESYGPFHINLLAGRIDPTTKQAFTRGGAEDIERVVQYVLDEYRRTGGLGAWNPGAYERYQHEIPERAERKRFYRGRAR